MVTVMRGQTRVDEATPPALRDAAETPTYFLVVSPRNKESELGTRFALAMHSLDGSADTILVDDRCSDRGDRPRVRERRMALEPVCQRRAEGRSNAR